jgi:glycosyltransferase involved in cell wall biosynthesis
VPEAALEGQIARYTPPGDAGALAKAMIETARDPAIAQMGRAATQLASTRFTIQHTWKEYEALFQSLLSANS